METPKCKKCGKFFNIPNNPVDMVYVMYCKECIKKSITIPLNEFIKIVTKQIGL